MITKEQAEELYDSTILKSLKQHHKETYQQIIEQTSFLYKKALLKQRLWHIKEQIFEPIVCKMCSNKIKWDGSARAGQQKYRTYCSRKCNINDPDRKVKKLQTEIERYGRGRNQIVDKIKQTNQSRYGSDYAIQKNEYKQKRSDTVFKKYGVKNVIQSDKIKQKREQTNLERYGNVAPARTEEKKQKTTETLIEKYGSVTNRYKITRRKTIDTIFEQRKHGNERLISIDSLERLNDKQWLEQQNRTHNLNEIANNLNVHPSTISRFFQHHNLYVQIHKKPSKEENEIVKFLQTYYSGPLVRNDRSLISPQEIDIYLPELNLAIEYDCFYWHGEENAGRNSNYHLQKTQRCAERNVHLVHIWENEWYLKRDIVKSRLKSFLGVNDKIPARKCKVYSLTPNEQREFLNQNHIQGYRPTPICYGLVYNGQLVAVMSFGKSRFNKQFQYEMIRFANTSNTTVIGGASKLLKHFIRECKPNSIISYSDNRWNTGNLYLNLGFTFLHNSKPNYFYFRRGCLELKSRQQFQKHKLANKLKIFDPQISEWKNMQANGYDRIWDCGNAVYCWNNQVIDLQE